PRLHWCRAARSRRRLGGRLCFLLGLVAHILLDVLLQLRKIREHVFFGFILRTVCRWFMMVGCDIPAAGSAADFHFMDMLLAGLLGVGLGLRFFLRPAHTCGAARFFRHLVPFGVQKNGL